MRPHNRQSRLAAILFYLSSGLTYLIPWLAAERGDVTDAVGRVWHIHDLQENTVVVMLFTMAFTAALAALRLSEMR